MAFVEHKLKQQGRGIDVDRLELAGLEAATIVGVQTQVSKALILDVLESKLRHLLLLLIAGHEGE